MLHPKTTVDYLYEDETMSEGLDKFRNSGYTALPVIDRDGIYVGTVSEGDFLRVMLENNLYSTEAQDDYVISDLIREGWNPPLRVTAPMDELLGQVMEQNFLPIVDDRGCFAGIITRRDIISWFKKQYEKSLANSSDNISELSKEDIFKAADAQFPTD